MSSNQNVSIDDIYSHSFWRHRIVLDDIHFTPGYRRDRSVWEAYGLPDDMTEKTFLDVGASDGLFSFEAERRGASHVVATDLWELSDDDRMKQGNPVAQESMKAFELVRKYLDSDVEDKSIDMMDLSPESVGTFDVVLCSGVLQSVRDPFAAIEKLLSLTDELLVIQNEVSRNISGVPGMEFQPKQKPQIWYPNKSCFEEMFSRLGHDNIAIEAPANVDPPAILPPIKYGVVNAKTQLFEDPKLEFETSALEFGARVKILCARGDAYRIHYRPSEETWPLQGWVHTSNITQANLQSVSDLMYEGTKVLAEDGLSSFARKAVYFALETCKLRKASSLVFRCRV